jgi:hypothetical protein
MLTSLQALEKTKGAAPDQENAPSATNEANHNADRATEKAFCTLQARFAVAGHTLYRTVNADGTMLYLAGKWGYCCELKSLEAVAAFLMLIGGHA